MSQVADGAQTLWIVSRESFGGFGLLGGSDWKTHVACCWRHQFDKTLARPGYAVCGGFPDVDASGAVGLRGAPVGFADV